MCNVNVFVFASCQPVFRRAQHLHAGGAGHRHAAADGAQPAAHAAHAHRAAVAVHVPAPHRLRAQHPAEADQKTG